MADKYANHGFTCGVLKFFLGKEETAKFCSSYPEEITDQENEQWLNKINLLQECISRETNEEVLKDMATRKEWSKKCLNRKKNFGYNI